MHCILGSPGVIAASHSNHYECALTNKTRKSSHSILQVCILWLVHVLGNAYCLCSLILNADFTPGLGTRLDFTD